MYIFPKIKYIIISAFFSAMINSSAFSKDTELKETTPMSVASERIISIPPNEKGSENIKKIYISEESNTHLGCQDAMPVKIKKSSRIPKPIIKSASMQSSAEETPAPLPLAIHFYSSHTNTPYQLDDFIGKR